MTATQLKAKAEYEGQPVFQSELRKIRGGPEGVLKADRGYMVGDFEGNLYIKQSDKGLATGWCEVTTTCTGSS